MPTLISIVSSFPSPEHSNQSLCSKLAGEVSSHQCVCCPEPGGGCRRGAAAGASWPGPAAENGVCALSPGRGARFATGHLLGQCPLHVAMVLGAVENTGGPVSRTFAEMPANHTRVVVAGCALVTSGVPAERIPTSGPSSVWREPPQWSEGETHPRSGRGSPGQPGPFPPSPVGRRAEHGRGVRSRSHPRATNLTRPHPGAPRTLSSPPEAGCASRNWVQGVHGGGDPRSRGLAGRVLPGAPGVCPRATGRRRGAPARASAPRGKAPAGAPARGGSAGAGGAWPGVAASVWRERRSLRPACGRLTPSVCRAAHRARTEVSSCAARPRRSTGRLRRATAPLGPPPVRPAVARVPRSPLSVVASHAAQFGAKRRGVG